MTEDDAATDPTTDAPAPPEDSDADEGPMPVEELPDGSLGTDRGGDAPATAGAVIAVVAAAGAVPWWPGRAVLTGTPVGSPLAVALGVLALVAFAGRRGEVLDRAPGAAVAAAASTALVAVSIVRLVAPGVGGGTISAGYGLPVVLVAGIAGVGLAVADYRGVDRAQLRAMGRGVGVTFGVILVAFVALFLLSAVTRNLPALAGSAAGKLVLRLLVGPLTELAFLAVAVAYVVWSGRGWSFIDLEWPSLLEAALSLAGAVGLLVLQFGAIAVIFVLKLPQSSQSTIQEATQQARELGQPELVLVLVPMMLLVVGPIEELLFRNVVQKRLYEAFARKTAVLVAGLVFAGAHVLAYADENHAAVFVSLATIFVIALLLGFLYEYTGNLTVPAVAHGIYNATLVLLVYVALWAEQQGLGSWIAWSVPAVV